MRFKTSELLADLKKRTEDNIRRAEKLGHLENSILTFRLSEKSWNALECIEHLLKYGDFYIPEIKQKMLQSNESSNTEFKSSWLGNYFAQSVAPLKSNKRAKKMSTLKPMNTLNTSIRSQSISKFLDQQKETLAILERAQNYDLNKVKTGITISSLIKLRLGDTLRVVIYHNQRHLDQAEKACNL